MYAPDRVELRNRLGALKLFIHILGLIAINLGERDWIVCEIEKANL